MPGLQCSLLFLTFCVGFSIQAGLHAHENAQNHGGHESIILGAERRHQVKHGPHRDVIPFSHEHRPKHHHRKRKHGFKALPQEEGEEEDVQTGEPEEGETVEAVTDEQGEPVETATNEQGEPVEAEGGENKKQVVVTLDIPPIVVTVDKSKAARKKRRHWGHRK